MAKNTALAAYRAGERRAQRAKGKHRRAKMTIPLAVAAGFLPLGLHVGEPIMQNPGDMASWKEAGYRLGMDLTGYDARTKTWGHIDWMARTLGPILLGVLAHKVANRMGINRQLSRMRIPLLRI